MSSVFHLLAHIECLHGVHPHILTTMRSVYVNWAVCLQSVSSYWVPAWCPPTHHVSVTEENPLLWIPAFNYTLSLCHVQTPPWLIMLVLLAPWCLAFWSHDVVHLCTKKLARSLETRQEYLSPWGVVIYTLVLGVDTLQWARTLPGNVQPSCYLGNTTHSSKQICS